MVNEPPIRATPINQVSYEEPSRRPTRKITQSQGRMKTKSMTKEEGPVISENIDLLSHTTPIISEKEKPKDTRQGESSNPLDTLARAAESVTPPSSPKEAHQGDPHIDPPINIPATIEKKSKKKKISKRKKKESKNKEKSKKRKRSTENQEFHNEKESPTRKRITRKEARRGPTDRPNQSALQHSSSSAAAKKDKQTLQRLMRYLKNHTNDPSVVDPIISGFESMKEEIMEEMRKQTNLLKKSLKEKTIKFGKQIKVLQDEVDTLKKERLQ
ncbi:hypothetical protein L6452_38970 [Arctium lappa]|uniref:Uncharacterized protein n=1 Tax=Arctium lappa TaxID=4217 RepID=A0ACB8XQJ6_ARCLA|nr:hypothetical protein L6452_38970 [Arctium lappa]